MITILIVAITSIVSFFSFSNRALSSKLDFNPSRIKNQHEYYRFFSHAFVHADWMHLIINMLVFYSFGTYIERRFYAMQEAEIITSGALSFLILYFAGATIASVKSYVKNRHNPYYIAVGASGAVSAILFTSIFFSPMEKIYFYGILPVPGIIFGVLYLAYSSYMSKNNKDNINHDAHFWGAMFGFIYPIIINPSFIYEFLNQL